MQAGWGRESGVICDGKVAVRVKGKVYETVFLYGLKAVVPTQRQEAELEVKMTSLGVMRMD